MERLEKARQAKVAKREAILAEKNKIVEKPEKPEKPKEEEKPEKPVDAKGTELPPPNLLASTSATGTEEEIKLPPKIKKTKAKKVVESSSEDSSDDDSNPINFKKAKKLVKGRKTPYMKIKLYKEPTNQVAFQNLVDALNYNEDAQSTEETKPEPSKPIDIPPPKSNLVVRGNKPNPAQVREINQARLMALQFFQ